MHREMLLHDFGQPVPPRVPGTDPAPPLYLSEADEELPTTPYGLDEATLTSASPWALGALAGVFMVPASRRVTEILSAPRVQIDSTPPCNDDWPLRPVSEVPDDAGSISPLAIDDTLPSTPKPRPIPAPKADEVAATSRTASFGVVGMATLTMAGLLFLAPLHRASSSPDTTTRASAAGSPALTAMSSAPRAASITTSPEGEASPDVAGSTPEATLAVIDRPPTLPSAPEPTRAPPAPAAPAPLRPPAPPSSEQLTALGEAAVGRTDYAGALSIFERVVSMNPNYVPARLWIADLLWKRADRAAAEQSYARIVEEFPESLVPERARLRARTIAPEAIR